MAQTKEERSRILDQLMGALAIGAPLALGAGLYGILKRKQLREEADTAWEKAKQDHQEALEKAKIYNTLEHVDQYERPQLQLNDYTFEYPKNSSGFENTGNLDEIDNLLKPEDSQKGSYQLISEELDKVLAEEAGIPYLPTQDHPTFFRQVDLDYLIADPNDVNARELANSRGYIFIGANPSYLRSLNQRGIFFETDGQGKLKPKRVTLPMYYFGEEPIKVFEGMDGEPYEIDTTISELYRIELAKHLGLEDRMDLMPQLEDMVRAVNDGGIGHIDEIFLAKADEILDRAEKRGRTPVVIDGVTTLFSRTPEGRQELAEAKAIAYRLRDAATQVNNRRIDAIEVNGVKYINRNSPYAKYHPELPKFELSEKHLLEQTTDDTRFTMVPYPTEDGGYGTHYRPLRESAKKTLPKELRRFLPDDLSKGDNVVSLRERGWALQRGYYFSPKQYLELKNLVERSNNPELAHKLSLDLQRTIKGIDELLQQQDVLLQTQKARELEADLMPIIGQQKLRSSEAIEELDKWFLGYNHASVDDLTYKGTQEYVKQLAAELGWEGDVNSFLQNWYKKHEELIEEELARAVYQVAKEEQLERYKSQLLGATDNILTIYDRMLGQFDHELMTLAQLSNRSKRKQLREIKQAEDIEALKHLLKGRERQKFDTLEQELEQWFKYKDSLIRAIRGIEKRPEPTKFDRHLIDRTMGLLTQLTGSEEGAKNVLYKRGVLDRTSLIDLIDEEFENIAIAPEGKADEIRTVINPYLKGRIEKPKSIFQLGYERRDVL